MYLICCALFQYTGPTDVGSITTALELYVESDMINKTSHITDWLSEQMMHNDSLGMKMIYLNKQMKSHYDSKCGRPWPSHMVNKIYFWKLLCKNISFQRIWFIITNNILPIAALLETNYIIEGQYLLTSIVDI